VVLTKFSASLPFPKKSLVETTISCLLGANFLKAFPRSISDWFAAYVSAVSKKLIPNSKAF